MSTITESALQAAAYEHDVLHVVEIPPGSNDGADVRKYLRSAGVYVRAAWCAAFVTWCYLKAGLSLSDLPVSPASTGQWKAFAKAHNHLSQNWEEAERGDLFVRYDENTRKGHIGFICETRKVNGRWYLRTIEGNSNTNGSREGTAVVRRGQSGQSESVTGWRPVTGDLYLIKTTRIFAEAA